MNIKFKQEWAEFLKSCGTMIQTADMEEWYHYPFWIRDRGDGTFEVASYENIPEELKKAIQTNREQL